MKILFYQRKNQRVINFNVLVFGIFLLALSSLASAQTIIDRLTFPDDVNVGVFLVIGAGICIAASAMILKVTLRTDTPDQAALYQVIYMLPFAFVATLFVWKWPTWEQWFWGFMLGALSTTAQRLYSRAFATGEVGSIAPFDFTRLPFVIAIGFVCFSELPDVWTVVGGTIIFCASIFAGRTESRRQNRKSS